MALIAYSMQPKREYLVPRRSIKKINQEYSHGSNQGEKLLINFVLACQQQTIEIKLECYLKIHQTLQINLI